MSLFIIQMMNTDSSILWSDIRSTIDSVALSRGLANTISLGQDTPYRIWNYVPSNKRYLMYIKQDNPDGFVELRQNPLGTDIGDSDVIMGFYLHDIENFWKKDGRDKLNRYMFYGSVMSTSEAFTPKSLAANAAWWGRSEDFKIKNLLTDKLVDHSAYMMIWFFVYKGNNDLYYIIPNPALVQVGDMNYNSDTKNVFVLDDHMGNIGDVFLTPKFSKNVMLVNDNTLIVDGDSFEIEPFSTVYAKNYSKYFDPSTVKCISNHKYSRENGKIKVDLNSDIGFIKIRWNTGTRMDLALTHKFRKEYTVLRYK